MRLTVIINRHKTVPFLQLYHVVAPFLGPTAMLSAVSSSRRRQHTGAGNIFHIHACANGHFTAGIDNSNQQRRQRSYDVALWCFRVATVATELNNAFCVVFSYVFTVKNIKISIVVQRLYGNISTGNSNVLVLLGLNVKSQMFFARF